MSPLIAKRITGNDLKWSIPIADNGVAVNTNTLADYHINLFYFVGAQRKTWLEYRKTPSGGQKQINTPTPASGVMEIIIGHDVTVSAPLTTVFAEVRVAKTDAAYPDNLNWITVLDSNTGKPAHPICTFETAAA